MALLRHEDRATRQAAGDSITAGLKDQERVLVFIFNTLMQDKSIEDRLRGFQFAEQSRHMANELDRETVDLVIVRNWIGAFAIASRDESDDG